MIARFYLPLLSTNVKHPKFGWHVTSLCQGLRRSAGSGGEDPENQVVTGHGIRENADMETLSLIIVDERETKVISTAQARFLGEQFKLLPVYTIR